MSSDNLPWPPVRSQEVSLHDLVESRTVAGSMYGIGGRLPVHGHPLVADIKTVWHGGTLKGWIYVGDNDRQYFQLDEQTAARGSISLGAGLNATVGAANDPGLHPLHDGDLHRDWVVLEGFDHRARPTIARAGYPYDGANAAGSPIAVGDQIPNGTAHGTSVVDITVARDGNRIVGWLYLGADGKRYEQLYLANLNHVELQSVGINLELIGAAYTLPQYGQIKPWSGMSPTSATIYDKGFDQGRCLVGDGNGANCVSMQPSTTNEIARQSHSRGR